MSRWEEKPLGELCEKIGSGATPKGGKGVYVDKGVSLIRSQNVYNLAFDSAGLAFIDDVASKKLQNVTVEASDVLLNITGDSVARTCIVPSNILPARVNQHVAIVRPKTSALNSEFLAYYLASPNMQAHMLLLASGKGASRNALTKEMIERFLVPVPPLDEQRRIAGVLAAYDKLIENNRKQITLLEEAADSYYENWSDNCDPSEFASGVASDYFQISIGKTPPRAHTEYFSQNGIPWVSVKDLGDVRGSFLFQTNECITKEAASLYKCKILPKGTIFLSFKLTVGRVAIIGKAAASNEAIAHFYTDSKPLRLYTYEYLRHFNWSSLGSTSAIGKAINSKIVKAIPFPMPAESSLLRLYEQIAPIIEKIRCTEKQSAAAREARDRLLPRLMSGEIQV